MYSAAIEYCSNRLLAVAYVMLPDLLVRGDTRQAAEMTAKEEATTAGYPEGAMCERVEDYSPLAGILEIAIRALRTLRPLWFPVSCLHALPYGVCTHSLIVFTRTR